MKAAKVWIKGNLYLSFDLWRHQISKKKWLRKLSIRWLRDCIRPAFEAWRHTAQVRDRISRFLDTIDSHGPFAAIVTIFRRKTRGNEMLDSDASLLECVADCLALFKAFAQWSRSVCVWKLAKLEESFEAVCERLEVLEEESDNFKEVAGQALKSHDMLARNFRSVVGRRMPYQHRVRLMEKRERVSQEVPALSGGVHATGFSVIPPRASHQGSRNLDHDCLGNACWICRGACQDPAL